MSLLKAALAGIVQAAIEKAAQTRQQGPSRTEGGRGEGGEMTWAQNSDRGIPVPGGPTNSTPAGDLAPRSVNFFGFLKN